jgi:hypothetical protein
MLRYIPIIAAVALLAGVAVVQGQWTERWGKFDPEEVVHRVDALSKVPMKFGRWEGTDQELDERQLKIAKVSGVVQRSYRNIDTGQEVSVYLATGKARSVSVHTPDKCYAAAGFRQAEDQVAVPVKYGDGKTAEFYTGHFRKDAPEGTVHLRIFWSWNATGEWLAPQVPKVTFAKYPALYKMYVIRLIRPGEQYLGEDPSVEFLEEFLPILEETLNDRSSSQPAEPKVASSGPGGQAA